MQKHHWHYYMLTLLLKTCLLRLKRGADPGAVINKLVHIIFSVLKNKQPFVLLRLINRNNNIGRWDLFIILPVRATLYFFVLSAFFCV